MSVQEKVHDIMIEAGKLLLSRQQAGFTIKHKGSIDLVTDVDQEVEAFLTTQLRRDFPSYSVFGEEEGFTGREDAEYLWHIDPIDGTTNFAHGFPYFSISVALARRNEVILGAVYHPPTQTLYSAELGQGAFRNDERIYVSKTKELQKSLFTMGFPYDIATSSDPHLLWHERALKASQGVLTLGSAALDLCQVASGHLEAFLEKGIESYDIAAGSLIVKEAGGQVSAINGGPFDLQGGEVLATNGRIHPELVQLLAAKA